MAQPIDRGPRSPSDHAARAATQPSGRRRSGRAQSGAHGRLGWALFVLRARDVARVLKIRLHVAGPQYRDAVPCAGDNHAFHGNHPRTAARPSDANSVSRPSSSEADPTGLRTQPRARHPSHSARSHLCSSQTCSYGHTRSRRRDVNAIWYSNSAHDSGARLAHLGSCLGAKKTSLGQP